MASSNILEVKVVDLPEMLMIGLPVNVAFKHGDFGKIGRNKEEFDRRIIEIPHAVNREEYYAPWFNCEVMFTYFYCLQVSSLEHVPEGMMGFSIPARRYLRTEYEGPHPMGFDPYEALKIYREKHGINPNKEAMILEKYRFADDGRQGKIALTVFGPVE